MVEGVLTFSEGTRYEGDFKNGVPNGYGIETWPDGSFYLGEWFDGLKHGEGVITGTDGSIKPAPGKKISTLNKLSDPAGRGKK